MRPDIVRFGNVILTSRASDAWFRRLRRILWSTCRIRWQPMMQAGGRGRS